MSALSHVLSDLRQFRNSPYTEEDIPKECIPIHEIQSGRAKELMQEVFKHYNLTPSIVSSRCRRKQLVKATFHLALLLRNEGWSYGKIGKLLGFHHTSVMYGVRKYLPIIQKEGTFYPSPSTHNSYV